MKFLEVGFLLYLILFICVGCAVSLGNYMYDEFWPDDNPVEEFIEEKIEEKTGFDVDLTPTTPETKKEL